MSNKQQALEKFDPGALAAIIGRDELVVANEAFAGGIQAGEWLPQISIKGNRFSLRIKGETTPIPNDSIEIYLIKTRDGVSKTFYKDGYKPGSTEAPDCSSADGITPDSNVENPVSPTCALCPNAAWGSAISKATGKQAKACSDYKLIVVSFVQQPDTAFALRIPAASLKPYAAYIDKLTLMGCPANAARTRIKLDPKSEFASLTFEYVDTVQTREEFEILQELAEDSDVLNAIKIQPKTSDTPTTHTAEQPVAVAASEPVTPPTQPPAPTPTAESGDSKKSLSDLIGKKPTEKKKATRKKAEPKAAEQMTVPAQPATQAAEEGGEQIGSLDAMLASIKSAK